MIPGSSSGIALSSDQLALWLSMLVYKGFRELV